MKFSINDFSSKCDQIRRKLRIWSRLLKKFANLVTAIFYQILIFRQIIALQKLWKMFFISSKKGQVDSPESPETPEITEIIENFIKVAKHLTKLKETLTNFVWEKSHFKKQ